MKQEIKLSIKLSIGILLIFSALAFVAFAALTELKISDNALPNILSLLAFFGVLGLGVFLTCSSEEVKNNA